ncbi:MAG: AraC family transcriptional regulator [Suipraeoptans sp.]
MNNYDHDMTYTDLNPTFLFVFNAKRTEDENDYHSHDFIELAIITEGEGVFYINGNNYPVSAGDLVVLNPGTYHKSMVSNSSNCTTEYYIAFTDIHFRDMPPNTLKLPDNNFITSLKGSIKGDVFNLCSLIADESSGHNIGRYFMLKSYLIRLLVLISREHEYSTREQKGFFFESPYKKYVVEQMLQYFDNHYTEKISLELIARNMYLSTFYLSKIFKSETGDTPINYLINLRMKKASEIIKGNPTLSVKDTASMVGYADTYHFSKVFKKHFGIPPSDYKRTFIN